MAEVSGAGVILTRGHFVNGRPFFILLSRTLDFNPKVANFGYFEKTPLSKSGIPIKNKTSVGISSQDQYVSVNFGIAQDSELLLSNTRVFIYSWSYEILIESRIKLCDKTAETINNRAVIMNSKILFVLCITLLLLETIQCKETLGKGEKYYLCM